MLLFCKIAIVKIKNKNKIRKKKQTNKQNKTKKHKNPRRYDVRGALSEITPYEAPPGGYGNRLDYLTSEEQRAEQLCEEERYFYLFHNDEEDILYQEEDVKRHNHGYSQVGFQYDDSNEDAILHGPNNEKQSISPTNDSEQTFELPANFELPSSIELPKTIKQHAIIEKTARFIMTQGAQMEILIKAKQSNNLQFEFLNQNSHLNPYYKAILNALRNGTYPTEIKQNSLPELNNDEINKEINKEDDIDSKPLIIVPTIKYKPSANCAYTQLISKIKGTPLPPADLDDSPSNVSELSNQYNVTVDNNEETNLSTEFNGKIQNINENKNEINNSNEVTVLKSSNALLLAQCYSSDTDSEDEKDEQPVGELNFPIPPDYLQNIIDKTAGYVIKNGRQFEETLRTKNDERFTFLWHDNEFYPYYMYKITGDPDAAKKEKKLSSASKNNVGEKKRRDKIIGPVCFSIKTRDDTSSACMGISEDGSDADEEKQIRLGDHSHIIKSQNAQTRTVPEHVQKAIKLVESQLMARNAQMGIRNHNATGTNSTSNASQSVKSRFDIDQTGTPTKSKSFALLSSIPSIGATTTNRTTTSLQQNQQKVLKRAEDKVKDKLAQIAREKLGGLLSKEKQLQYERKRKAMAFLNQIKGTPTGSPLTTLSTTIAGNSPKIQTGSKNASDSDDMSVHSIPISFYGGDDDKSDDDDIAAAIEIIPVVSKTSPKVQNLEKFNNRLKFKRSPSSEIKSITKRLKREESPLQEISRISTHSRLLSIQEEDQRQSKHQSSRKKLKQHHRSDDRPNHHIRSSKKNSNSRSPSLNRKRSHHRHQSYSSDCCSTSHRHRSRSPSDHQACSSHHKKHKRSPSRKHKKRRKHHR